MTYTHYYFNYELIIKLYKTRVPWMFWWKKCCETWDSLQWGFNSSLFAGGRLRGCSSISSTSPIQLNVDVTYSINTRMCHTHVLPTNLYITNNNSYYSQTVTVITCCECSWSRTVWLSFLVFDWCVGLVIFADRWRTPFHIDDNWAPLSCI